MEKIELTEDELLLLIVLTLEEVAGAIDDIFWELYVKKIREAPDDESGHLLNCIDDTIFECSFDASVLRGEILDKRDNEKQDVSEDRTNYIIELLNNKLKELLKFCLKDPYSFYEIKKAKKLIKRLRHRSYLDELLEFRLKKGE